MKVLPQKYDELNIGKYDKQLLALLKNIYKNDDEVLFLLCCNPTKTDDGVVHVLITRRGVLLFNMKDQENEQEIIIPEIIKRFEKTKNEENIIRNRFLHQRNLQKKGKVLFPFRVITFFTIGENPNLDSIAGMQMFADFCDSHCVFKNIWKDALKNKRIFENKFLGSVSSKIDTTVIPDIVNRIAPEYTIPQLRVAIDKKNDAYTKEKVVHDANLSLRERSSIAYILDDSQINYINKIKKGDQLIVACAGSGKSVILISKCFKVAALNPDKRFLITGYNRNLVSYFKWLIDSAGFTNMNVDCLTFDKLCVKLLNDNGIRVPSSPGGDHSKVRDLVIHHMNTGKISTRYYGVFIDEVQMFEPEWYKVCYQLIENKNSNEHFFVICGDKSQSVKKAIKSGKAPWQGHGDGYPNFRGKSFPIEINYRNSRQINEYIRRFTDGALKFAEEARIPINQDADIFLRGKSFRDGVEPQYIQIPSKYPDSDSEAIKIVNQIEDIHNNYHIPYDSIAVICYNRQYRFAYRGGERDYKPISKLVSYLRDMDIPYSLLNSSSDEYAVSYSNITGVPIVTMESSLGLDFKAVIICGLFPLGLHDHTKNEKYLIENRQLEETVNAYNKNINILYMACARAKDILRIITSEEPDDSVYIKLLYNAFNQGEL